MTTDTAHKALKACRRYTECTKNIEALTLAIGENLNRCPGVETRASEFGLDGLPLLVPHLRRYFKSNNDADLAGCEHCQRALVLVRKRREMRSKLGAAKRFIRRLGETNNAE